MANKWQQWYAHDISDWNASYAVQTFTDAAYRAYHTLLMAQFESEDGMLPYDHKQLARLSRMGVRWQQEREGLPTIAEEVLAKFETAGEQIYDKRMLREWQQAKTIAEGKEAAYEELVATRSQAAKRGLSSRWGSDTGEKLSRAEGLKRSRELATHTPEEWDALIEVCNFSCARCCTETALLKEHIRPITRGGSDGIENLQPLCKSCSCAKGGEWTDYRPENWQKQVNSIKTSSKRVATSSKRVANVLQTSSKRVATSSFTVHNSTEQDSTEQNKDNTSCSESKQVRSEPHHPGHDSGSEMREEGSHPALFAGPETSDAVAGTLPLNDGTPYPITRTQVAQWAELYPAIDVVQQCRQMKGWMEAHPTRRKTKRGVLKFVHSWLSRAQDGAGRDVQHGTTQRNSSGADARVRANQEAVRRATERRGIFDPESPDDAIPSSLSAPGAGAIAGDIPTGLRVVSGSERLASTQGGIARVAGYAGPQVFPTPLGGR